MWVIYDSCLYLSAYGGYMRYSTQNAMQRIWKHSPDTTIRIRNRLYGPNNTDRKMESINAAKRESRKIQLEGKGLGMGDVRVVEGRKPKKQAA